MTPPEWVLVVTGIVGGSAGAALVTNVLQRRKLAEEAHQIFMDTAADLVRELRTELGRLRKQVESSRNELTALRVENDQLRGRISRLEEQVRSLGYDPINGPDRA